MDNDRASQSRRKRKNHSFLKVRIEDFSTRLEIPPDFYNVFGKEEPKKAILETYYGNSEEVEVEKHENRLFFCKGWSKFVEKNKLESEDSLQFKYLSECSKFKVKIYGKGYCEKEHYYPSETGKNEDERDGQKRKREEEKEQDTNVKKDGTFKAAKMIETDSESRFGDGASENELINLDSDTDSSSSHTIVEEEIGNSKQLSSEEKENGESNSLHSDNLTNLLPEGPFFPVKLKSTSRNNYVNIPISFAREFITESHESPKIKVEMPNKEVCELGVFVKRGVDDKIARARLSQGYRNLVNEYNLKEGDICIFELIEPTHELVFHLYVYRRDAQNKLIRIP